MVGLTWLYSLDIKKCLAGSSTIFFLCVQKTMQSDIIFKV